MARKWVDAKSINNAMPIVGKMMRNDGGTVIWPHKQNILGVNISATTYEEALVCVIKAAKARNSCCVSHIAVHGLIEGSKDLRFRSILEEFEIVAPDGQPVRLALRLLHGTKLPDRCYGPEFMLRVCRQAQTEGIEVFLYGSYPNVVEALRNNLHTQSPQPDLHVYHNM